MHTPEERIKHRAAIDLDIMQLVNLAEAYATEAERWCDLSLDMDKFVKHLIFAMEDENQQIFVATVNGKIVGAVWAAISGLVWTSEVICHDLFLYVDPGYRGYTLAKGLVSMLEDWAKACGAKVIHTGANSGVFKDNPASLLYKGLGYDAGGYNFYKSL